MSITAQESERRGYERHAVELNAAIKPPGKEARSCRVLDFCPGGLFLSLGGTPAEHEGLLDQVVRIKFCTDPHQRKNIYTLKVRVVRVSSGGVGVAFEAPMPVDAFKGLQRLSEKRVRAARSKPLQSNATSLSGAGIKASCTELARNFLPGVVDGFYEDLDETLLDYSDKAQSNDEKTSYLDALASLKKERAAIEKKFLDSTVYGISHISDSGSMENRVAEQHQATDTSLSILEKDEFEDWLNLSDVVAKTENLFEEALRDLDERFSIWSGVEIDKKSNPLGPAALCDHFRVTVEESDFDKVAKQAIYKIFESALATQLGDLYGGLSELMTKCGIVARQRCRAAGRRQHTNVDTAAAGDFNAPNMPGDPQHDVSDSGLEAGGASFPAPHDGPLGAPQQGVFQTARNLFNLTRPGAWVDDSVANDTGAVARVNGPQYSANELLGALNELQAQGDGAGLSHLTAANLEQQVLDLLGGAGGEAKHLDPHSKQTLQISHSFVDTLLNDAALSAGIKPYIEKLQVPLLKTAVADPNFLDSENHPARNVLNLLDQLGINEDRIEDENIRTTLAQLEDYLAEGGVADPAVFQEFGKQLEGFVQPLNKSREKNFRRVLEVCEGKQKIQHSKETVRAEINRRIGGKRVAKVIPSLLNAGWQHLLVITNLRQGIDSTAWQRDVGVIDRLLEWLSGDKSNLPESAETQSIVNYVDEQLFVVCPDKLRHGEVIRELTALLVGDPESCIRKTPEQVRVKIIEKKEITHPDGFSDSEWNELDLRIDQFRVGDWFVCKFKQNPNEALKLAWLGDDPRVYVFINRKGIKRLELGREQFAKQLNKGLIEQIDSLDTPLTDRASNAMLQRMQADLLHSATHDPLTGLVNRKEFFRHLKHEFAKSKLSATQHTLCYIEFDQFRIINNSCGNDAVDQLLKQLSDLITNQFDDPEVLARLGDDTFGLILKHTSSDVGEALASRFRDAIRDFHFNWEDRSYSLGVSIGLVTISARSESAEILMKSADFACMKAKESGRNCVQVFQEDDENLKVRGEVFEWAGRIDKVLEENRLFLRCQEISPVTAREDHKAHFEVLLGVTDEQGELIPPDRFIPAVEWCKRMPDIDRWVVSNTMDWMGSHRDRLEEMDGFSINLSGQSINTEDFLNFVKQQFETFDIPPEKITFEITETAAIENLASAGKFIKQIRQLGCKFSLDDFGSGLSSYSYLKSLNVDFLKIDGMFVKDLASSSVDYAMVKSMNEIGHSLGMATIAEYVEDDEILKKLGEIGVDFAQGFGVRKPLPITELADSLH